ncbi:MAG: biotin--[acetyl-CoA-carboxylase] ligase [Gemmatimonadota bacterium]
MSHPESHRLTQVPSTLDVIHELAAGGAPHGTVVLAEEQLQGRGTRGRTWHSPPGGFWYSILYREITEGALELLSLRIGLAVARAIESVAPTVRLGIKWPNDIMLDDKKAGGILCEARWQGAALSWIAVGVGVNVANPIPPDVSDTATTLASRIPGINPELLLAPISRALRSLPLNVAAFSADEQAMLNGRDWLQGRAMKEPVAGVARGIQPDGSLLVEQPDGTILGVRAGRVLLD